MDKIQTIDELIKELQEIKENYGNIKCYDITFYIEGTNTDEKILVI